MNIVAFFTSEWVFIILTIFLSIYLFSCHKKIQGIELITGTFLLSAIVLFLKVFFKVPRPENPLILTNGYAFPSWHSAFIVFFVAVIYLFFVRKNNSKKYRIIFDVILIFTVLFIGFTRIWFNVHTLRDVLFGYLIGVLITFFTFLLFNLFKKYY